MVAIIGLVADENILSSTTITKACLIMYTSHLPTSKQTNFERSKIYTTTAAEQKKMTGTKGELTILPRKKNTGQ